MVNSRGARGVNLGRGRGRGNLPGQVNSSANRVSTRSSNATPVSTVPLSASNSGNELCGFCSLVVGSDGIGCDQCSNWYHPSTQCTGLKTNTVRCIQEEGGDTIRYVCNECRCQSRPSTQNQTGSSNLVAPDSQFTQETVGQLFEMVKCLAQSVALLTNKFNSNLNSGLGESLSNHHNPVPSSNRESLFAEFHEYDERKKRRESIIVRGIAAANETEFITTFDKISLAILGRSVQPDNIVCINHQTNLYRIKIVDNDTRRSILTNAKKLRDTDDFKNVFLSRDLTYLQRQELRARRVASSTSNSSSNPNMMPLGTVQLPDRLPELSDGRQGSTNPSQNF